MDAGAPSCRSRSIPSVRAADTPFRGERTVTTGPGGHWQGMSKAKGEPSIEMDEPPNLRPGPAEQGGHGGMATREQESPDLPGRRRVVGLSGR